MSAAWAAAPEFSDRKVKCARLHPVTAIRPAASAEPAQWLLQSEVGWWDLVRYGPPGFEVYVRIAFADGAGGEGEDPALRTALVTLAS